MVQSVGLAKRCAVVVGSSLACQSWVSDYPSCPPVADGSVNLASHRAARLMNWAFFSRARNGKGVQSGVRAAIAQEEEKLQAVVDRQVLHTSRQRHVKISCKIIMIHSICGPNSPNNAPCYRQDPNILIERGPTVTSPCFAPRPGKTPQNVKMFTSECFPHVVSGLQAGVHFFSAPGSIPPRWSARAARASHSSWQVFIAVKSSNTWSSFNVNHLGMTRISQRYEEQDEHGKPNCGQGM